MVEMFQTGVDHLCLLQPLVFGAMIHRDEAFEAIFSQYVKITTTGKAPASVEL